MEIKTIGLSDPIISKEKVIQDNDQNKNNSFSSLFNDALNKVNELQLESDSYKKLLVTGDVDNLHDVTIAAEKADVALQLTLGIRNKVVEAYREIMRMQI